ncbi:hypothetical protein SUGI_0043930 [Cryptomeria japonica]|nr:hypothetical protein SUGI_0043930 [Cryptomeria japonica]
MYLIEWYPHFNPWEHKVEKDPMWIRLYKIPMEYWSNEILIDIGKGLVNERFVDKILEDRVWRSYNRMRIDISTHQKLPLEIEIHSKDGIWISKEREDHAILCPKCKSKVHDMLDCNGMLEINMVNQYNQKLLQCIS